MSLLEHHLFLFPLFFFWFAFSFSFLSLFPFCPPRVIPEVLNHYDYLALGGAAERMGKLLNP